MHALDALRAAPVVELPLGLDRRQQVAHHLAGMALRQPLARLGRSASRSKSPRGVDRDVRLPAKTEIVSPPLSAETSTQRRRPRFEPFGPKPDPTPTDGPDPYGNPDPEWLRIDWRQYLRTINVPSAGNDRPLRRDGAARGAEQDPLAIVFVHGLSGCWQNWLENIPHFARSHRVLALDLPGFGPRPCPTGRSRSPPTAGCCSTSATSSASATASWSATRWAASSPPRRRSRSPSRFEKLVLVSAAGVSQRAAAPGAHRGRRAELRRRDAARLPGADALAPPAAARGDWRSA